MNNNKFFKITNETYLSEEKFDIMFVNTIYNFKLKNYLSHKNYGKWDKLSQEKKLKYCYSFFDVTKKLDFAIEKQVDIFTRLILIDFDFFSYDDTIECMFGIFNKTNSIPKIEISYNPLIPIKHYKKHLKKMKKNSDIDTLKIPSKDFHEYLKDMFQIWFYYKHKNYTAYEIANKFYTLKEEKDIKKKIKNIKKVYKYIKSAKNT